MISPTMSGANIRTIQQYEGRAKNISKAASATLRSLAHVRSCRIEDLHEYNTHAEGKHKKSITTS